MPLRTMLIAAALALAATGAADAQTATGRALDCADFFKNPDGTWSPVRPLTVLEPSGVAALPLGIRLRAGPVFPTSELAARLSAVCG